MERRPLRGLPLWWSATIICLMMALTAQAGGFKHPAWLGSTTEIIRITGVEFTDTATILSFHERNKPGWWIRIAKETFLEDMGRRRYKAIRGEIDPLTITAFQYDLVCNGVELSSGAVRNHDPEIMVKAFQLVRLGEEDVKKKFPAMYNAFCYGAPPHAGIAPGVDRMVMLLAGEESIREIIPFPMNKNAQDLMMGAPSFVEQKQLDELHIQITEKEEDEAE